MSEVVGVLLMVAIVVSLGVIVFTFASTGLGSLSQNFVNLITNGGNKVSEQFVVEQVTYTISGSPGTSGANLYVRNVGPNPVTLVSVYIVNQTANAFVKQVSISTAVNVGSFTNIPFSTLTFTPKHGFTYSFTITSSLGNSVIYNAKAN